MIFKYQELRLFFDAINKQGTTKRFSDWKDEKVFLVRHDIDFDLELAHRMAVIEKEKNIVATFFILTTSDCYNVLSIENTKILKSILSMGHEIGLHFDPTLYGDGDLKEAVDFEIAILSKVIGKAVKSISLHNPSIHGKYPLFDGYINAYDPSYFSDKNYISDSCRGFRGKDPFEFLSNIDKGMVQILLHPMHYSEEGDDYAPVVCRALIRHANKIHSIFSVNRTYVKDVGPSIEDSLKKFLP